MTHIKFYNSQTAQTYNTFQEIPEPANSQFFVNSKVCTADQLFLYLKSRNQSNLSLVAFRNKNQFQTKGQICNQNQRCFPTSQIDACNTKFSRIIEKQFKVENYETQNNNKKMLMKMLTQEKEYNIFGQTNIKQIFKSVPFQAQIQEAKQLDVLINSQRGQQLRRIIYDQVNSTLNRSNKRQKSFSASVLKDLNIMEIKALNILWKRAINEFVQVNM